MLTSSSKCRHLDEKAAACGSALPAVARLQSEKFFSEAHVPGKMIRFIRLCGGELCEAL